MIKIELTNIEQIEELHKLWYTKYIFSDLEIKYNLLNKGVRHSRGVKIYMNLLRKIISFGSDYCIQRKLFLGMSQAEIKVLKKLLTRVQKKSLLEKILQERFKETIKKSEFSMLIQDLRKNKLSYDSLLKELEKDLEKYPNINFKGICDLISKENYKPDFILNISEGKKMVYEIKEFHISNIFDYENLFASKKQEKLMGWGRHSLISKLNVDVCPYCQRNYITSYIDDDSNFKKTTADLDHFYSKSDYPYLALSLYNFIPSCQICNSRFKSDRETYGKIIYPYESSFDDEGAKFEVSEEVVSFLLDNSMEFYLKINDNDSFKVKNSIKMFKLDEVYKTSHNKYVKSILENLEKRPDSYIESITDDFFGKENEVSKEKMKDLLKNLVKEPYRHKIENGEPLA